MARTVSSSGFSRRSRPRISAPICLLSGTTSSLVRVMTVMAVPPRLSGASRRTCHSAAAAAAAWGAALPCSTSPPAKAAGIFSTRPRPDPPLRSPRTPLAPPIRFADEVDAERVIERRVEGMIVVDVGGVDPHPAVRPLGAAQKLGLLDDVRAHGDLLECQAARAATVAARCLWKKTNTLFQPSSACSGR